MIDLKSVNLKNASELNKQAWLSHIRSGDDAHLSVSGEHAGFMTPELLRAQNLASGNRIWLTAGTDISTLAPGHYVGTDFVGSAFPESHGAIIMIDVTSASGDGGTMYRQIVQMLSVSGEIRVTNTHGTSALTPKGYSTIERVSPLWSGSVFAVGTKLSLNDTIANMSAVQITTDNGGGGVKTTVIPKSKSIASWTVGIEDTNVVTNGSAAYAYKMIIKLTEATATISSNLGYDIHQQINDTGSKMTLIAIEGVF